MSKPVLDSGAVVAFMQSRGVPSDPYHYALTYNAMRGCKRSQELLSSQNPPSEQDVLSLFSATWCAKAAAAQHRHVASKVGDILGHVIGELDDGILETTRFGETLKWAHQALVGAEEGVDISEVIKLLSLAATDVMQSNQSLHGELTSAKVEIDALREQLSQANREKTIDPLTGVNNRYTLNASLSDMSQRATERGEQFSVIMVDVDHFKRINDTYGHGMGDLVLQQVAKTVRSVVRDSDVVARYGGEEFAVVLPGADARIAAERAEGIRKAVESIQFIDSASGRPLGVTVSAGVSEAAPGDTSETLLKRADEGLYAAKNSGRNRVVVNAMTQDDSDDDGSGPQP